MFKEFKQFIARGNVLDLAIAFLMGAAFGKVITSFVNDILMPPIGMLAGKVDFSSLFVSLNGKSYESLATAKASGAPVISYGAFINTIIDFIIVAFAIFVVAKMFNRYRAQAPDMKDCPHCLTKVPVKATKCPACTSELGG